MMVSPGATRFAPAKINLFLHVGAKRPDNYHELKSLVVFASVGDTVTIEPAKDLSLAITGPYAKGLESDNSNLVLKASDALMKWAKANGHPTPPVHLKLDKSLPIASGIGGGSSDAAATLHLLTHHWKLPLHLQDLSDIGASIGADVPVCLRASASMMSGIGEIIEPAPVLPEFSLVLINPNISVPTANVFQALSVRSGAFAPIWPQKLSDLREFVAILDRTANDLAPPAKAIAPLLMRVEEALVTTQGCLLARMSGSGATCFGIYPTLQAATSAAKQIRAAHETWWVKEAGLHSPHSMP